MELNSIAEYILFEEDSRDEFCKFWGSSDIVVITAWCIGTDCKWVDAVIDTRMGSINEFDKYFHPDKEEVDEYHCYFYKL